MSLYWRALRTLPAAVGPPVLRARVTVPGPPMRWPCLPSRCLGARAGGPGWATAADPAAGRPQPSLRAGIGFAPAALARLNRGPDARRPWWRQPPAADDGAPPLSLPRGSRPETTGGPLLPGLAEPGTVVSWPTVEAAAPPTLDSLGEAPRGGGLAASRVPTDGAEGAAPRDVDRAATDDALVVAIAGVVSAAQGHPDRTATGTGTATPVGGSHRRAPRRRPGGPAPAANLAASEAPAQPTGPGTGQGSPGAGGAREAHAPVQSVAGGPSAPEAGVTPCGVHGLAEPGRAATETTWHRLLGRLVRRHVTILVVRHRHHRGILLRVRRDYVALVDGGLRVTFLATDHISAVIAR